MQVLAYNECLLRSKYAYDFAVLFDVDEFIYMNTTALGIKGPIPLPKFLRQTFPPKVRTLSALYQSKDVSCGLGAKHMTWTGSIRG